MVNLAKETGIAEVPNETVKFMMNAIEVFPIVSSIFMIN